VASLLCTEAVVEHLRTTHLPCVSSVAEPDTVAIGHCDERRLPENNDFGLAMDQQDHVAAHMAGYMDICRLVSFRLSLLVA
jgi:hypothetical protein